MDDTEMLANDLAEQYPVTWNQALEYIELDLEQCTNMAEMACKIRGYGFDHTDLLFALHAGFDNLYLFSGLKYRNLEKTYTKLTTNG